MRRFKLAGLSSFEAVLRDALEHLVDFCSLRLDLDVLKRVRLSRPALINDSPFSWVLSYSPLVRVTM